MTLDETSLYPKEVLLLTRLAEKYGGLFTLYNPQLDSIMRGGEDYPLFSLIGYPDGYDVVAVIRTQPAHFFSFTLTPVKGAETLKKPLKFNTGSGTLSDFWPTIQLFLEGMIDLEVDA